MGFVLAAVVAFWKAVQENEAIQKHSCIAKALRILANALHTSLPQIIVCSPHPPTLLIKHSVAPVADGCEVFSQYLKAMPIGTTEHFISCTEPEKRAQSTKPPPCFQVRNAQISSLLPSKCRLDF